MKLSMTSPSRFLTALSVLVMSAAVVVEPATAQSASTLTAAEQEQSNGAETIAPGREDLNPTEPGFDDNAIDNQTGANWEPTGDAKREVIPGHMRSDREDIPGGFTKKQADQAELQEAQEKQSNTAARRVRRAAPANCRTYWPSPFKVCGAIRERYDQLGGPKSFLAWPKSDELGVPDGVGRRNEFINGFIYWHPSTGAHPVTTHFSIVWARNGWEAGALGYPTSDEFGLPGKTGRKQTFQRGHIYGSLAGLASVKGAIYDKWISLGAEGGPLGYPVSDETTTPDGLGRFNEFTGGMIYWHPELGAWPVSGVHLLKWAASGYEKGPYGYPTGEVKDVHNMSGKQSFQNGILDEYVPGTANLGANLERLIPWVFTDDNDPDSLQ